MPSTSEPPLFSTRMRTLRRSTVREVMKAVGKGNTIISFAGGLPRPDLLPADLVGRATAAVMKEKGPQALQYGSTEGYYPLREYVAENVLAKRGIVARPEDVLITAGSQQALDLIAKIFVDPGSPVVVEDPTYMAALQAFEVFEPCFVPVRLESDGVDLSDCQEKLRQMKPRFFYTISTFQNPTGACYTEDKRRKVAAILQQNDVVLVEDDPYSELYFESPPPGYLAAHCPGRAIVCGSFSKTWAPGLRLGWVFAPEPWMTRLVVAKQAADLCTGAFNQHVLYECLQGGLVEKHLGLLRQEYRKQRDAMLDCIRHHFGDQGQVQCPGGGMFVWLTLPPRVSGTALLERTLPRGVVFAPGASFFAEAKPDNTARLSFTHANFEQMETGIAILAEECRKLAHCHGARIG